MTTFLNADAARFDAQLEAARLAANVSHYDALFAMPRLAVDECDLIEMAELAVDGPVNPKEAADALFARLVNHLEGDDVAIAALTALHTVHNEDRYQSGRETAFDEGAKHAH